MTDDTTPTTTPTIRVRLSNRVDAAVEFSAQDGRSLAHGAARAFARFVAAHGPTHLGGAVSLSLQVRPTVGGSDGWVCPVRRGLPVEVRVSAALLERRPPDDWTEIWSWVQAARAHDDDLGRFQQDVRAMQSRRLPTTEDDRDGR